MIKNKKAQMNMDWEELIKLIIVLPILLVLIGVIFGVIGELGKDCPECEDCSPYKEKISNLTQELEKCKNNSKEIIYKNRTVEKEVPVEKIVYNDSPFSISIISISFVLSVLLTIKLFKFEIKLPKETEKKIKRYDNWIKTIKIISSGVSILILIKLLMILF